MKESISYSFLLNIVFLFVFVCFAIIMGVLSYYKAFRANTIISETIEKYEGYNCVSKEEIARKLSGIGYNTPFKVSCKSSDGKCDDSGDGYKVISYNLDFEGNLVYDDEQMNSTYICDDNGCATNKHYQYGIYTYMYVELPVVSNIIRIPLFTKTSIMYEFRNFYVEDSDREGKKSITDTEQIFDTMYTKNYVNGRLYVKDAYYGNPTNFYGEIKTDIKARDILGQEIMKVYALLSTDQQVSFMGITKDGSDNVRYNSMIEMIKLRGLDSAAASNIMAYGINGNSYRRTCGFIMDYSKINNGG